MASDGIPRLDDLGDVAGRRVLVRCDFNVPLDRSGEQPTIIDDFRIRAALPTIEWLTSRGASASQSRRTAVADIDLPRPREKGCKSTNRSGGTDSGLDCGRGKRSLSSSPGTAMPRARGISR